MPTWEHVRIAARLRIAADSEVVNYVSVEMWEAYTQLSEAWRQLNERLNGIDRVREGIARQHRPAPEGDREHLLAESDRENLQNLREDLVQVTSAGTAYETKWDEKSAPWQRNPKVMGEFNRQKAEFEEVQQSRKQEADRYLERMERSVGALEVAPAYSLQPAEQEQTLARGVPTTFPQAPAPAHSLLPTGQERVLHQPPPYAGPSHLPWQPQPGGPARRPPSR